MSESVFEPIEIIWDEKKYEIPSNEVMGLIERIEDRISFADLARPDFKFSRLASAWGTVLRYVGVVITDEQIYKDMLKGATLKEVQTAINALLMIMIPPEDVQKKTKPGPSTTPKLSSIKKSGKKGTG